MSAVHWIVASLHKARVEDGMSQEEVAERIGRVGRTLSDWERGIHEPGLAQVEAWAATHGLYVTLSPDRPKPAPLTAQAAETVMVVRVRRMLQTGEARRTREAAELSQREIAAAVGVDPKAVHKWETGVCRPSAHSAVLYGRFLLELQRVLALTPSSGRKAS